MGGKPCLAILAALVFAGPGVCSAQLPNAPAANLIAQAQQQEPISNQVPPPLPAPPKIALPSGPRLTLADAEKMALAQNPNISVARLLQLASTQVVREARSADLPLAVANLTAVGANPDPESRLTGEGTLNSPRVLEKAAGGLTISQLITDFGRTRNLVHNAKSTQHAELENMRASVDDITLTVDQAFYNALTAQKVLIVAEQTVATRQATGQQIGALTNQNLRSTLDLSLADVQVSQAQLLVLDAQNAMQAAMANLNAILGSDSDTQYFLADQTPENPEPAPADAENLVQEAFRSRPDLASLNDQYMAAKQFASAEHDLLRPTISALASVGGTPVRDDLIESSYYAAAGANVSIPVFNGFDYTARAKEADFRARAASEQVRNLRDNIARDVRTAVLDAQIAFQKIAVNKQLLDEANTSLVLAQARYKVGLSGIVDLTQAQLAQTQAEIGYANARYAYQSALAMVRYQIGQ
jgi:outer membrane protein